MELIGKIIQVLEERGGVSARTGSEWRMGSYVLETTTDRFPRKMVFEVFGADKIESCRIAFFGCFFHPSVEVSIRQG